MGCYSLEREAIELEREIEISWFFWEEFFFAGKKHDLFYFKEKRVKK